MLKTLLYAVVGWISKVHSLLLRLNDKYEYSFSDKQLHFLVIGLLGMIMVLAIYPVFKWLVKKKAVLTLTWIYVFTLILVLTFAIEIGQKITNTGAMEFADIVFGVVGFLMMFAIYALLREIYHATKKLILLIKKKNQTH